MRKGTQGEVLHYDGSVVVMDFHRSRPSMSMAASNDPESPSLFDDQMELFL